MGKGFTSKELAQELGSHYKIVPFEVKFEETKGSTCKVMIGVDENKEKKVKAVKSAQAAAGCNFKNNPKVLPGNGGGGDIAKFAHKLAEDYYESSGATGSVPKQLSAKTLEGA